MLQNQRCFVLERQISTSVRELILYGHEATLTALTALLLSQITHGHASKNLRSSKISGGEMQKVAQIQVCFYCSGL